jgi:hypothetical protein
MIRTLATTFLSATVLCSAIGCGPKRDRDRGDENPAESPAGAAPTTRPFDGPGIQLAYGGGWKTASDPNYVLVLVPDGTTSNASDVSVSVEVPKLPPHIPGLIPLGSVVNGYVDDMKKQHVDVQVEPPVATKVAGANARRVASTWKTTDGKSLSEDAVLTVKGDRVFIFRANADESNRERASTALDGLIESVRWQ